MLSRLAGSPGAYVSSDSERAVKAGTSAAPHGSDDANSNHKPVPAIGEGPKMSSPLNTHAHTHELEYSEDDNDTTSAVSDSSNEKGDEVALISSAAACAGTKHSKSRPRRRRNRASS